MNERIEKIAHEQGIPWDNKYHWYVSNTDLKRFAELIIKECMEWCDAHATINGTAQQIRDSIKKDFGVEE